MEMDPHLEIYSETTVTPYLVLNCSMFIDNSEPLWQAISAADYTIYTKDTRPWSGFPTLADGTGRNRLTSIFQAN